MSYYIGVMSGTSLDGVDIAISSFAEGDGQFKFVRAKTFPFPEPLYQSIKHLINEKKSSLQTLGKLDIAIGQLIGLSINAFLTELNISAIDIKAIGCHGQTVFHYPESEQPFSMQIGNANVIAELTGITTVADFRQRDIAAGGQGAPLVPAFHHALFKAEEDRVIVNIGGISNITFLPSSPEEAILGFDTGPGNVLLDYWIQSQLDQAYDSSGQWAASGTPHDKLLSYLLNEAYFELPIPKSTGRELFNSGWLNENIAKHLDEIAPEDIQATLVELTAITISNDIKKHASTCRSVFICGGGAYNNYLLTRLQGQLNSKVVATTEMLGLHPDWVEACAFAWLAYRTINKQTGSLPSVTGAQHPVILGAIYPA